jgi:hypothetical protein
MKRAKVSFHLAVLHLCLASFLLGCSGDRRESFYPFLADADKDGAITRGWIPDDLLPRSSQAIREVHELSPSREWCSFEFLPAEWQKPKNDFKSVDSLPPSLMHVPSPGVSWWPAVLRGNLDVDKIHGEGLKLYVVERPATSVTRDVLLFAIDGVKGRGFFYRTAK